MRVCPTAFIYENVRSYIGADSGVAVVGVVAVYGYACAAAYMSEFSGLRLAMNLTNAALSVCVRHALGAWGIFRGRAPPREGCRCDTWRNGRLLLFARIYRRISVTGRCLCACLCELSGWEKGSSSANRFGKCVCVCAKETYQ